jgi:hypothetical protein
MTVGYLAAFPGSDSVSVQVTGLTAGRRGPEADHLESETRRYYSDLIPNEFFGPRTQQRNKAEVFMQIHQRHCGVVLLKMVQCMADVTPVLFQHDGNKRLDELKPRDAPRRCKRFERLEQWVRDNSICLMVCNPEDKIRISKDS